MPTRLALLGTLLLALLSAGLAPATQPARQFSADQFLRFNPTPPNQSLDVSILTLKGQDGVVVDLVSAVHIADAAYFHELNRRFESYDAVLYEMVKSEGATLPSKSERRSGGVSGFQRFLSDNLKLTFQLDEVDYSRTNFVHADLTAEAFAERQKARKESLVGLMLRQMIREMGRPIGEGTPPPNIADILLAMQQPDKHRQLKLILGSSLGDVERALAGLDSRDNTRGGSAILTDRNDAALAVFRAQRAKGVKRIAIFYGAAHMPDLAEQLTTTDHLKPAATEWLTAWNLSTPPATQPATRP
jgi:hypothetical protein